MPELRHSPSEWKIQRNAYKRRFANDCAGPRCGIEALPNERSSPGREARDAIGDDDPRQHILSTAASGLKAQRRQIDVRQRGRFHDHVHVAALRRTRTFDWANNPSSGPISESKSPILSIAPLICF
jgi:hypothetical protein